MKKAKRAGRSFLFRSVLQFGLLPPFISRCQERSSSRRATIINAKFLIHEHALNDFYARYGYGEEGGIKKNWDMIKFGPISLPLPNLESRRKNIYLHDISHLVTGYGTNWLGESSVTSWEVATGGWGRLYFPWFLTLWGMAVGVMFYPRHSYRAFQAGLRMKSAFTSDLSKAEMYSLTIEQLQSQLQRTETELENRSYYFWAGLSLLVWFSPFLLGFVVYGLL